MGTKRRKFYLFREIPEVKPCVELSPGEVRQMSESFSRNGSVFHSEWVEYCPKQDPRNDPLYEVGE